MRPDIPAVVEASADSRGRIAIGTRYAGQQIRAAIEAALDLRDLTVGFARHKLGITAEGKVAMYADRRFGIDWGTGPLVSEDVFDEEGQGAVKDIRAMNRFTDGALVFAFYGAVSDDHALIGIVPPGSDIEPVGYEARSSSDQEPGGDEVQYIKTLKLHLPVEVTADQAPDLLKRDNHPRGSVRRWKSMADTVREIYAEQRGFRLD